MSESSNASINLENAQCRWTCYRLFIVAACALAIVRIFNVSSASEETPFQSANDRSRWSMIRELGDNETYQIDQAILTRDESGMPADQAMVDRAIFLEDKSRNNHDWNTIDKVVHRGADGQWHFYSSKPPLFPTLLAIKYRVIKWVTGWKLETHPFEVGRTILICSNVFPFAVYLCLLAILLERFALSNWTRMFVMAAGSFGTFLSSFAVTLNNHLPAAISVMICVFCLLAAKRNRNAHWAYFFVAGISSAFAAANELPALSFFALASCLSLALDPKKTLAAYGPGAAIVIAAFFFTNYLAHGSLNVPYSHRSDGKVLAEVEGDFAAALDQSLVPDEIREAIAQAEPETGFAMSDEMEIFIAPTPVGSEQKRWEVFDPIDLHRLVVVEEVVATRYQLREWDNWYEYPASNWLPGKRSKIDQGEPSQAKYAWHLSFGHHGFFSLTPIWLIGICGLAFVSTRRQSDLQLVGVATIILFATCFAFYVSREQGDRNYGGQTSGLRWLFWFTPLFLVGMIPICDQLAKYKAFRWLAEALLAFSIFSTSFAILNPWTHPWLYQWFGPLSD